MASPSQHTARDILGILGHIVSYAILAVIWIFAICIAIGLLYAAARALFAMLRHPLFAICLIAVWAVLTWIVALFAATWSIAMLIAAGITLALGGFYVLENGFD